jgi:SAM-dependent methyltransferase
MSPAEYDVLRAAEEDHWWYAVLHRLVEAEMQARVPHSTRVLDAGCGTGGMITRLTDWDMHGIDISPAAVRHCQQRGLSQVIEASVHDLPFESASFSAVLSLDVLYHQHVDDNRALKEMARVLKPGGILILNLPAFAWLRGSHDRAVGGARRYTACQVRGMVLRPSLEVDMIHYWNAWLLLPLLIWRHWTRLHPDSGRSDVRHLPVWLNLVLKNLGRLDACASRQLGLIGSSLFTIAHRHE